MAMNALLRELRRLAAIAAAGPIDRWRNPPRLVIPDRSERFDWTEACPPHPPGFVGRIYVPFPKEFIDGSTTRQAPANDAG